MPRKKMIDQDMIPLKNVDQLIIDRKDCLEVNLVYDYPFSSASEKAGLRGIGSDKLRP